MIVEVLSPSTEAYDRGKKFDHYKTIPSLKHYVLVSQDRMSVHVFDMDGKTWETYERPEHVVTVHPGVSIRLEELYRDVDTAYAPAAAGTGMRPLG